MVFLFNLPTKLFAREITFFFSKTKPMNHLKSETLIEEKCFAKQKPLRSKEGLSKIYNGSCLFVVRFHFVLQCL